MNAEPSGLPKVLDRVHCTREGRTTTFRVIAIDGEKFQLKGLDSIACVTREALLQEIAKGETRVSVDQVSTLPKNLQPTVHQYIAYFQRRGASVTVHSWTQTDDEHCEVTVYHDHPSGERKIFVRTRTGSPRWEIERVEHLAAK